MALEICPRGDFFMETCDCWEVQDPEWGRCLEETQGPYGVWLGNFLHLRLFQGWERVMYAVLAWCLVWRSYSQISISKTVRDSSWHSLCIRLLGTLWYLISLESKFHQVNIGLRIGISQLFPLSVILLCNPSGWSKLIVMDPSQQEGIWSENVTP